MPFKNMKSPPSTGSNPDTQGFSDMYEHIETTPGREGFAGEYEQMKAQMEHEEGDPNARADAKGGMHSDPIEWPEVGGRKPFKVR